MAQWQEFLDRGWIRFDQDTALQAWAEHARPLALQAAEDPAHAEWLDCQGTWFIGVDALPNDLSGQLAGGPPLQGAPLEFIARHFGGVADLHRAQVSVVYPGYPRPRAGENEAAFRYRSRRDAAHVDGVKMFGAARHRRVEEPHAWVLGIPLTNSPANAAPLVVWEGSHEVMRRGFARAFAGHDPQDWHLVDVTEAYKKARAEVFETCSRVCVHARPGEAYLMHRLCLHGVAAWEEMPKVEKADTQGRAIAYFRPDQTSGVAAWIKDP